MSTKRFAAWCILVSIVVGPILMLVVGLLAATRGH